MKQEIILPGVRNARELGGYPAGGRTIRKGVFIRTAALDQISEEGLQRLQDDYHVQTVIDFRMSVQQSRLPDPVIADCENLRLPVVEVEDFPIEQYSKEFPDLLKMYNDPKKDPFRFFQLMSDTGMINDKVYAGFLLGERGIRAYRSFFQAVLSLEEGRAILWHCTDGKDRTGCAAMLLLYALGASEETIYADYLLTNEYHAAALEAVRKKAEPYHLTPDKTDLLLFLSGGVSRCYLENGIKAICEHFGSVEGYLAGALGVGEEEQKIIRSRFLV